MFTMIPPDVVSRLLVSLHPLIQAWRVGTVGPSIKCRVASYRIHWNFALSSRWKSIMKYVCTLVLFYRINSLFCYAFRSTMISRNKSCFSVTVLETGSCNTPSNMKQLNFWPLLSHWISPLSLNSPWWSCKKESTLVFFNLPWVFFLSLILIFNRL